MLLHAVHLHLGMYMKKYRLFCFFFLTILFCGCAAFDAPASDTVAPNISATTDSTAPVIETQVPAMITTEEVTTRPPEIEEPIDEDREPPHVVRFDTLDDVLILYDIIDASDDVLYDYLETNGFVFAGIKTRELLQFWLNRIATIPIYNFPAVDHIRFAIYPDNIDWNQIEVCYIKDEKKYCLAFYHFSREFSDESLVNMNDSAYSEIVIENEAVSHLRFYGEGGIFSSFGYIGETYTEDLRIYLDTPEASVQELYTITDSYFLIPK